MWDLTAYFCANSLAQRILSLRERLIGYSDSQVVQFGIWAAHTIVFSQLGIFCTRLSPVAAGNTVDSSVILVMANL